VATKITPLDNVPYMVEGELELVSPSGEPIAVRGSKAFLCRCGGSTLKPFSDGTHSRIGVSGGRGRRGAAGRRGVAG
jgi:CDGSH-type Zn-finger protein